MSDPIAIGVPIAAPPIMADAAPTPDPTTPPSGVDETPTAPERAPETIETLNMDGISGIVEVVYLLDATGSMDSQLNAAKALASTMSEKVLSDPNVSGVRSAVIVYRDHGKGDGFVTKERDFSNNPADVSIFLAPIRAYGGGDGPEAVAPAFDRVLKLSWTTWDGEGTRPTRLVIHCSDAPPHGVVGKNGSDHYVDGDPSGIDPLAVVNEWSNFGITYYFVGASGIENYSKGLDFYKGITDRLGGKLVMLRDATSMENVVVGGALQSVHREVTTRAVRRTLTAAVDNGTPVAEAEEAIYRSLAAENRSMPALSGIAEVYAPSSTSFMGNSLREARIAADAIELSVASSKRVKADSAPSYRSMGGDSAPSYRSMGGDSPPSYRSVGASLSFTSHADEDMYSQPEIVETPIDRALFNEMLKR